VSIFALVHGAWHGAWCWERLIPELERRGHSALAVDLPCDDDSAGFERYAEVLQGSLPDGDVVLVGHSLGACTATLVAAARPVEALVFVAGVIPTPGLTLADTFATETDRTPPEMPTERIRDPRAARPGRSSRRSRRCTTTASVRWPNGRSRACGDSARARGGKISASPTGRRRGSSRSSARRIE
jgi:pimeloyl-ACP methyl ester carboxylesterase